jgi:hypothetical protein
MNANKCMHIYAIRAMYTRKLSPFENAGFDLDDGDKERGEVDK